MRVVGHHLLSGTLALPHGFERAVPVQQLEDGHQLLEFQHGTPFVGLQHEAEGTDARIGVVRFIRIALQHNKDGRRQQKKNKTKTTQKVSSFAFISIPVLPVCKTIRLPPPLLFFLRHILLVTVAKSARNMEMTLLKKNRECIVLSLLFLNFILDSI